MSPERAPLPRTVLLLGLTSLFTDAGSEMIFPLLPVFLSETLGAGPAFLGLVEGAADTVASLLKLLSGHLSDRLSRRKPLVLAGYAIASVVRPLVALAAAPWHVLAVRLLDRVGKGVRSSPRDALIADAAGEQSAGRAFGFHRAMDHAGAVLGPLAATALAACGLPLRHIFLVAAIPGALSVLAVLLVRERALRPAHRPPTAGPAVPPLPSSFYAYLVVLALFGLGNSSDAFLLLRARDLGLPVSSIPLLWTVLHVSKLGCSYLGGDLSDRHPRARLIILGWGIYAATYLGLARAERPWHAWALFAIYGAYYGCTEPCEKALVRDLVPPHARGRAFGLYHFTVGVSALPAGLLMGALWRAYGPAVALVTGAALSAVAAALLAAWSWRMRAARATA